MRYFSGIVVLFIMFLCHNRSNSLNSHRIIDTINDCDSVYLDIQSRFLEGLDALIPKEDFEVIGQNNIGNLFNSISVTSFSTGLFYPFLRKPDFQRETNEYNA